MALLGAPAVGAAALYAFYDALRSTRRGWQMLHGAVVTDRMIPPGAPPAGL